MSVNPAIDTRLTLESFERGAVNRVLRATPEPGGKSLHVAMVLRTLGADPLWLGFAGGPTGKALAEGIRALGIRTEAIEIVNPTRTNLEIVEAGGTVTEILEPGPSVTNHELEQLQFAYESALKTAGWGRIAVLSGSLPPSAPDDFYSTLIRIAHESNCHVFLDASGEPLKQALNAKPDLVKPNQQETEWLSGLTIRNIHAAQVALKKILSAGASAAAISMGAAGIVYQSSANSAAHLATAPSVTTRSCTGSGDAALAGFAFAAERGLSAPEALRLAAACGTANCLGDGPGKARASDIERLKGEIQIRGL